MNKNLVYCELQQLMYKKESEEPSSKDSEITLPSVPSDFNQPSDSETIISCPIQKIEWEANVQTSSIASKKSLSQASINQGSISDKVLDLSYTENQSCLTHLNEKERQKTRSEVSRITKQKKVMAPCKHHSFLSEVPDVRHMEQALLQLLEDFHSGNLHAFGKDCSMEQMTKIREQQEKLARLHFEMGQRQDIHGSEQPSFRQSNANMLNLLQRLEQLSVCIENLHSK